MTEFERWLGVFRWFLLVAPLCRKLTGSVVTKLLIGGRGWRTRLLAAAVSMNLGG